MKGKPMPSGPETGPIIDQAQELSPLEQEGLDIHQRLQETEKAQNDAVNILSNLDDPENRQKLVDAVNKVIDGKTKPSDFEGSHLVEIDDKELKDQFGAPIFPLTLEIPIEKWTRDLATNEQTDEVLDITKKYPIDTVERDKYLSEIERKGFKVQKGGHLCDKISNLRSKSSSFNGIYIQGRLIEEDGQQTDVMPYPFNITGIALSEAPDSETKPSSQKAVAVHEELHRVQQTLRTTFEKKEDETEQDEKTSSVEQALINELNSRRANVVIGEEKWFGPEDKDNRNTTYAKLVNYLSRFERREKIDTDNFGREKLYEACETMQYLQNNLPQSVITHILLNTKDLDELNSWSKASPEELKKLIHENK